MPKDSGHPVMEWTPARKAVLVAYILFLTCFFAGVTFFIGLVLCYVKRGDSDVYSRNHLDYMISTSWWFLGLSTLAAITLFIGVGYLIGIGVCVWALYRYVKGIVRFLDARSV